MIVVREDPGLVAECAFCHLDATAAVELLHGCLREEKDVQACGACVARMAEHVMSAVAARRPS